MKIRKFTAPSVPSALRQVHDDLGDRAVILNTRTLPPGGDPDVRVEVTAAMDETPQAVSARTATAAPSTVTAVADTPQQAAPRADLLSRVYGRSGPASTGTGAATAAPRRRRWQDDDSASGSVQPAHVRSAAEWLASLPSVTQEDSGSVEQPPSAQPTPPAAAPPQTSETTESSESLVVGQLRQLEEAVHRMASRSASFELPAELSRLGERLRRTGLSDKHVHHCLQQVLQNLRGEELTDRDAVAHAAADALSSQLPGTGEIRVGRQRRVVGLVGPSGSGKSTAAARIAAGFVRRRRDSHGDIVMVHADDRRVGGLSQAQAFAAMIDVPLEAAYDEAQMSAALVSHSDARLVLVDVGGCGPHEREELAKQAGMLQDADEIHVVVDGLTGLDHIIETVRAWTASRPADSVRLLVTKMDQSVRPGAVVSAAIEAGVALSYLTTAATVPGGIKPGTLEPWIEWMVGRTSRPYSTPEGERA